MARSYRILQHWNQWLAEQFLGASILETEQQCLSRLLNKHFGKHALLIGVQNQLELLNATKIPCHTLITPLDHLNKKEHYQFIESDFHELPILTGDVDLVIIPHTLEFVDNPRQLLAEACRVIKPEGLIVICGFNPFSAWGLKKLFTRHKHAPWSGNFIHLQQVNNWLQLADFETEKKASMLFRPPVRSPSFYQKLSFLEKMGKAFPWLGGAYMIVARAKVIPLTPIKLQWKQPLSSIRISTSISGHIASHSK